MSKWRFCVAPMMDWTDRHCRFFHRILSRRARLFTEMLAVGAILHGDRRRLLRFDAAEHPLALQIGGSDPDQLAEAAAIGAEHGFDEINLNVGCPSSRVASGAFGACLMREPKLVGDCVAAMKAKVKIPVTIKCRTGVDEQDPETALGQMAEHVLAAGCDAVIVHARKAWLDGLSPKENREVPPLDYERVRRLKRQFPHALIVLNGGLSTFAQMNAELAHVDGVMVGRAAYQDPALLLDVDSVLFGETAPGCSQEAGIEAYLPYLESNLAEGVPLHVMTRPLLGLFSGRPGARAWRRLLTTQAAQPKAGIEVVAQALAQVRGAPCVKIGAAA
ncbi:MAG TPA: tRNA dihydrouridine(20/20a) synthase DusA [Methylocella sp.]|nr:tRNA dihydrouridine(20/20a) synthase DusA [Methylocella sp.]